MKHTIEISTERLLLKSITPDFIVEIFKTKVKEEIIEFFAVDESGYLHLKSMFENGMEIHRFSLFYFLLVDKNSDKVIGECGFHTWNRTHNRAELFYNLRDDFHKRKGLMTEALQQVLNYGFNTLELHRVEALTANWNTASVKLLEHFGFSFEGTMREDYIVKDKNESSECYSLLKWEWDAKNKLNKQAF